MTVEHPDEERIRAFGDGELPESERLTIAAHLDSCPCCAANVKDIRTVSQRIAAAGPAAMAALRAHVRATLAAEAAATPKDRPIQKTQNA